MPIYHHPVALKAGLTAMIWLVQDAANRLNVGVTTLKKICRVAEVTRWPFRKRTSIERLIQRTKHFIEEDDEGQSRSQRAAALQTLEEQREDLKVLT